MKRPLFLLSLLVLACMLNSCFEIIEEVELSADGSGSYEYTLNASQSKTTLDRIMLMDSVNGYRVPDKSEFKEPLAKLISQASKVEGISKVEKVEDYDNFIFSFKCEFTDIDALNRMVAQLRKENNDKRTDIPSEHFTFDEATDRYERNGNYKIRSEFGNMKDADKVILDGATFTSIFRSEQTIAHYSNNTARLSPNKQALMLRLPVIDLMKETATIGNIIQLDQ